MAPQGHIPVAANVLGTIGTVFWCIQLVPQIWTNWRTKSTEGLPALMMLLWGVCGMPFGAYSVIQNFNIPIQVQPQAFMGLCLISWVQIMVYGSGWSVKKGVFVGIVIAGIEGGIEAALILTLRPVYERGSNAPVLVVGIIASVLLAAGLVPPYFEVYKRRGRVVGINFLFLAMDCSGAFFSLMALVAQNSFDVLGGILYIICALLELGLFLSHFIWRVRTRALRKRAKAEGKTYDELAAEIIAVEGAAFPFAERPLPRVLTSVWWRRRLAGKTARSGTDSDTSWAGDEEQALPGREKAASPAITPPTAVAAAAASGIVEGTPVGTSAAAAADVSDNMPPALCGEAGVVNELDKESRL